MRQFLRNAFIVFSLITVCTYATPARAEMDSRVKALLLMAGYGTIGGALLGTASLAFDTEGRAVAKGASLGLYAGLLFGSYVVLSHYVQKQRRMNPQPAEPYYNDPPPEEEEGGMGGLFGAAPRWQEYQNLQRDSLSSQSKLTFYNKKARLPGQEFYVNLVNVQF